MELVEKLSPFLKYHIASFLPDEVKLLLLDVFPPINSQITTFSILYNPSIFPLLNHVNKMKVGAEVVPWPWEKEMSRNLYTSFPVDTWWIRYLTKLLDNDLIDEASTLQHTFEADETVCQFIERFPTLKLKLSAKYDTPQCLQYQQYVEHLSVNGDDIDDSVIQCYPKVHTVVYQLENDRFTSLKKFSGFMSKKTPNIKILSLSSKKHIQNMYRLLTYTPKRIFSLELKKFYLDCDEASMLFLIVQNRPNLQTLKCSFDVSEGCFNRLPNDIPGQLKQFHFRLEVRGNVSMSLSNTSLLVQNCYPSLITLLERFPQIAVINVITQSLRYETQVKKDIDFIRSNNNDIVTLTINKW